MVSNSSFSSRTPKHSLRNRKVFKKSAKKPKKGQGEKIKNNENVPKNLNPLQENALQEKGLDQSIAAQNLNALFEYENRENQLDFDEQWDNVSEINSEYRGAEEVGVQQRDYVPDDHQSDKEEVDDQQRDYNVRDGYQSDAVANGNGRLEESRRKEERKRYNDLKKDVQATNSRIDSLTKEWKAVKSIIQRWGPQPRSDEEGDIEDYNELPRLPLKKIKQIILMEENWKNDVYKKQLVS